jgi:hypothetical protein
MYTTAEKDAADFSYLVANLLKFFAFRKRFSIRCLSLYIHQSVALGFTALLLLEITIFPPFFFI